MKKLYILLIVLIFCVISCTDKNNKNAVKKIDNICNSNNSCVELVLRSQGGCTHIIEFSKEGNGLMLFGQTDNFDKDDFSFVELNNEKDFSIENERDLNNILNLVVEIYQSEKVQGHKKLDASHLELNINGVSKIDVYSSRPKKLSTLLEILKKHLPYEIDYTCW